VTREAWFLLGLVVCLVIGVILHSYSPWGKKWFAKIPTAFILLWIVPAVGTALFYVALGLAIVSIGLSLIGAVISLLINVFDKSVDIDSLWATFLVNQLDKVTKKLILNS